MGGGYGLGLVIQSDTALLCEWAVGGSDQGIVTSGGVEQQGAVQDYLFKKIVLSLRHTATIVFTELAC
jgi:hypothetical protein